MFKFIKEVYCMYKTVLIILFLIFSSVDAYDTVPQSKNILIREVYNSVGSMKTFYCNQPFKENKQKKLIPINHTPITSKTLAQKENIRAQRIEWEHVVPAENFGRQIKECRGSNGMFIGREACAKISPLFKKMLADPINLVPAIGEINADRSNFSFAGDKIPSNSKYKKCGIHIDKQAKKIYISDRLKGKVARIYLYMSKKYGMKLSSQEQKMFRAWDKKFPITALEKVMRSKKLASVKRYSSKMAKSKVAKRVYSKIVTKPLKYTTKALLKSSVKVGAVGVMSLISKLTSVPFVGIAAQVALDTYMMYEIDKIGNIAEQNKGHIQQLAKGQKENQQSIQENQIVISQNREYITRLEEEQKLLGANVVVNTQKIFNLSTDISNLTEDLTTIQKIASHNSTKIQNIKDGILQTGLGQLDRYFDSVKKDSDSLKNSINNLELIKTINTLNGESKSLILNSLNIAYIEKALLYKNESKNFDFLKKDIATNFDKIINSNNISIVSNAYISMFEIFEGDEDNSKIVLKKYRDFMQQKINEKLDKNQFEAAKKIADIYQSNVDETLTTLVLEQREKNYQKLKEKLKRVSDIDSTLAKNQNNLLNEEAVKVLYKQNYYNKMLDILKTKSFDSEEFKIKAFYLAYKQRTPANAQKLKKLVLNNNTYTNELKTYMEKH